MNSMLILYRNANIYKFWLGRRVLANAVLTFFARESVYCILHKGSSSFHNQACEFLREFLDNFESEMCDCT